MHQYCSPASFGEERDVGNAGREGLSTGLTGRTPAKNAVGRFAIFGGEFGAIATHPIAMGARAPQRSVRNTALWRRTSLRGAAYLDAVLESAQRAIQAIGARTARSSR
jgi:hypothetical protein